MYVSVGRARKKGAKCYALIPDSSRFKEMEKLHNYVAYNQELASALQINALHVGDYQNEASEMYNVELPPFRPNDDINGPMITAIEAVSLVYRYCLSLNCDKLGVLSPTSFWEGRMEENGRSSYKAYVVLPVLVPESLRDTVEVRCDSQSPFRT